MIDTHAHLDFPEFDQDREDVIARFFKQGGKAIVNVGVDLERSRESVELAEKYEGVFAAVGLHPDWFAKRITHNAKRDWIDELKKLARREKVVAIGETGLDYYRITHNAQRETQKEGFLSQINIARELDLPVIVHCREAWEDLYEIISNFNQSSAFSSRQTSCRDSSKPSFMNFVLHCYSGEKEDTEKFLKLPNVFFSFSGNITYPKPRERAEKLVEAVKMIPLDKIMLDSDAPFLAPQVFRGKRNEPAHVRFIAEKIAQIKQISGEEVKRATDRNARKFFRI